MTTPTTHRQIDYATFPEDDGEPMAETLAHLLQMVDLQFALHTLCARQGRPQVGVGGNQLMYYNPHSGWDHVAPDVYVTVSRPGPPPPAWRTWEQGGRLPELVCEITSPSTWGADVGTGPRHKPAIYGREGVQEYLIYDPLGEVTPAFQGFVREEGQWVALPVLDSGGIWSPLLRAELRPMDMGATPRRPAGRWLRVIDPQTGEPLPTAEEEQLRAAREAAARQAAEARVAEAEAEVARLREELRRRDLS